MGYKQESTEASDAYRQKLYILGEMLLHRLVRPWLSSDFMYSLLGYHRKLVKFLIPVHEYTEKFINKRRQEFLNRTEKVQDLKENM